jgi:hypothetical protein
VSSSCRRARTGAARILLRVAGDFELTLASDELKIAVFGLGYGGAWSRDLSTAIDDYDYRPKTVIVASDDCGANIVRELCALAAPQRNMASSRSSLAVNRWL